MLHTMSQATQRTMKAIALDHFGDRETMKLQMLLAAVGDRVKGAQAPDQVYAFGLMNPKGGFYADYAAVKAADVSRILGELTIQHAAVMHFDAMTALRDLDDTLALKPEPRLISGN